MQMRREQPAEAHRAISTVAKRLNVHPATLRLWVNQADVDQGQCHFHYLDLDWLRCVGSGGSAWLAA